MILRDRIKIEAQDSSDGPWYTITESTPAELQPLASEDLVIKDASDAVGILAVARYRVFVSPANVKLTAKNVRLRITWQDYDGELDNSFRLDGVVERLGRGGRTKLYSFRVAGSISAY